MKGPAQRAVVLANPTERNRVCLGTLAVGITVIMLIAGCEEQNLSNTKKHRLIAAENIRLKKELEQYGEKIGKQKKLHDVEIKKQKNLHDREIKKQKELLAKCLQEKRALREKPQEEDDGLTKFLLEENIKLREENEKLKAQVQQLEREFQELKEPSVP